VHLGWPDIEEVEKLDPESHGFKIMRLNRFLPNPKTEEEQAIVSLVVEKAHAIPEARRELIGRAVGWD